jgi:hypothetical protein
MTSFKTFFSAYSSRMRVKLCLIVGVRTLSLLKSRHKNPPHSFIHTPYDLHKVWFMVINFASYFRIGKAHGWGTFSKCKLRLSPHHPRPLMLRMPSWIILGL